MSTLNALSAKLLRSPLLWGGAGSFLFFALIHGGVITDPNVIRYLAGHWVEYVEVALFCVGLAALTLQGVDLVRQRRGHEVDLLGPIPDGGQPPEEAATLAATLPADGPTDSRLVRRVREALDFVARTGSADDLEEHLKYLSDLEAGRTAAAHGLVRFVVWAIPILGFLGTVIGITIAIANLSPTQLDNISGVVAGLGTAFDTTATALALSMVLMFIQFMIDRAEQRLLGEVDEAAWRALAGRFHSLAGAEGTALALARMGETVSRGSAKLLEAQEAAWRTLERTAGDGLRGVLDEAATRLQDSLGSALDASLDRWGESLVRTHDAVASAREQRWIAAAESLAAAVRGLEQHQQALASQTVLLGDVVAATRDLASLERSLDANLDALATTGRFEETLATLSAAVQLLSARARDVVPRRAERSLHGSGAAA